MTDDTPKLRSVDTTTEPRKPPAPTPPSFLSTLEELQGGTLPSILTRVLADVGMAVAEHASGKQTGKVVLEFAITRGKGPFQLELAHRIAYAHPTVRGKKTEEISDSSEVYINTLGHLSVVPDSQGRLFD
jgi:hypothetical protein